MKIQGALVGSASILALAASGVGAFATIASRPEVDTLLPGIASIEEMPLHAGQGLPGPAFYIRAERFQRGEKLPGLLSRLVIGVAEVARLARLRALQQLGPGALLRAED